MISFIVPAHNEAALIGATLQALREAAATLAEPFEILVVDDESSDATGEIAAQAGARVLPVAYRHIAATRNAGAAAAHGDRLLFVDADTHVDAQVLQAAMGALREGAEGGGAGVRLLGPLAWYERCAETFFVVAFRLARIAPGCFVFCSRAAFEAVGGFDLRYYAGEDVAFSRSMARRGRFVVLRQAVRTSARKLRTFTAMEHMKLFLRFALRGRRMLHSRDALGLWYGERRSERS